MLESTILLSFSIRHEYITRCQKGWQQAEDSMALHPAQTSTTEITLDNFIPQETREHILSFIPFNMRNNLRVLSNQFKDEIDNMEIPEKFIFPYRLMGAIRTNVNPDNSIRKRNYTLKELKNTLHHLSAIEKQSIADRVAAHVFLRNEKICIDAIDYQNYPIRYNRQNWRQHDREVLLMILGAHVMPCLKEIIISFVTYTYNNNYAKENMLLNTCDVLELFALLLLAGYILNYFCGASFKAQLTAHNHTQRFFKTIDAMKSKKDKQPCEVHFDPIENPNSIKTPSHLL